LVKTTGTARADLLKHEQILESQLASPKFTEVLQQAGIESVEQLVEFIPDADESKAYVQAQKDRAGAKAKLSAKSETGIAAKRQAIEVLKSASEISEGGSAQSDNASLAPETKIGRLRKERTTVPLEAGFIQPALGKTKSGEAIKGDDKEGKDQFKALSGKQLTFGTLITALEQHLAAYEKEQQELFPKSTEGRKQEKARSGLAEWAKRFFKQNQNELLNRPPRVNLLSSEFTNAARELGRDKANEVYLSELGNGLLEILEVRYAAESEIRFGLPEVKKTLDYFDTTFKEQVNEIDKSKQAFFKAAFTVGDKFMAASESVQPDAQMVKQWEQKYSSTGILSRSPFDYPALKQVIDKIAKGRGLVDFERMFGVKGSVYSSVLVDFEAKQKKIDDGNAIEGTEREDQRKYEYFGIKENGIKAAIDFR
jgi:glutathione S-transferase